MQEFIDKAGNKHVIVIDYEPGYNLIISSYDEEKRVKSGDIIMRFDGNKRIYLDMMYCSLNYRRLGLLTYLSRVADELLSKYEGYIIRGKFQPFNRFMDSINSKEDDLDLMLNTLNFYHKCGYDIVSCESFNRVPSEYPDLNYNEDFLSNTDQISYLVYKKIGQNREMDEGFCR